jgi:helix-turn-helix protein
MRIDPNGIYDLDEVSELFRQKKQSIQKKLRSGDIPAHRIGNRLLIFGHDLIGYIKQQGRCPKGGFAKKSELN